MNSLTRQRNNSQAVKVILSQLYLKWASEVDTGRELIGLINEILVSSGNSTLPLQECRTANGLIVSGNHSQTGIGKESELVNHGQRSSANKDGVSRVLFDSTNSTEIEKLKNDNSAAGSNNNNNITVNKNGKISVDKMHAGELLAHHRDPFEGLQESDVFVDGDSTILSPPVTPPSHQAHRRAGVDELSPSPVHSAGSVSTSGLAASSLSLLNGGVGTNIPNTNNNSNSNITTTSPSSSSSTRFFGVDELDYPQHRLGSPGVTPTSPHIKPVVDPMAPLRHGTSLSPQNNNSNSNNNNNVGSSSTSSNSSSSSPSSSGTLSPPSSHLSSQPGVDAVMMSMDLASSLESLPSSSSAINIAGARDVHNNRFLHTSKSLTLLSSSEGKLASFQDIPTFYTKKISKGILDESNDTELSALKELAKRCPESKIIKKAEFGDVSLTVFAIPIWLKDLLYETIASYAQLPSTSEVLTSAHVTKFYNEKCASLTPTRRLFELIRGTHFEEHSKEEKEENKKEKSKEELEEEEEEEEEEYITLDQLKTMTKYLVLTHPGLEFLKQPEFQEYYCRTVAIRIMYGLERQQSGKVTWRDFDRSNLPDKMLLLDNVDVNQVLEYFSYEHFYVLYCKFWELDTDRDQLVDYDDMCNYGQGSVVPSVIKRVVDGYGRPLSSTNPGQLDFEDFVYFCLSEEDKNTDPAVLYWFKVLDTDGDGVLSGYELNQFYRENQQRFLEYNDVIDSEVAYEDAMCQMLDMIGFDGMKTCKVGITLADLRACPTPSHFFNMIFNAYKFMQFEHRDPFAEHQQKLWPEKTDWDRFARAEYDRMAAEAQEGRSM